MPGDNGAATIPVERSVCVVYTDSMRDRVRTNIYLDPELRDLIQYVARVRQTTMSAVIREEVVRGPLGAHLASPANLVSPDKAKTITADLAAGAEQVLAFVTAVDPARSATISPRLANPAGSDDCRSTSSCCNFTSFLVKY